MDGVISGLHPAAEDFRLTAILTALADPARLAAVRTLAAKRESPCTRLQHDAGLTISREAACLRRRHSHCGAHARDPDGPA
jgi:hypothetical protein